MEENEKKTKIILTAPDYYHTTIWGHSYGIKERSEIRQLIEDLDYPVHH